VIKIERPGKGDFCRDYDYVMNGMSSQFAWTNRSKESLALNVKSAERKRVLDARSGIVWTPETLDKFITDPQALVPGNRMPYAGMANAGDRADLIAYLTKASQ